MTPSFGAADSPHRLPAGAPARDGRPMRQAQAARPPPRAEPAGLAQAARAPNPARLAWTGPRHNSNPARRDNRRWRCSARPWTAHPSADPRPQASPGKEAENLAALRSASFAAGAYFGAPDTGPCSRPRRSFRIASNSARLILSLEGLALIHCTRTSYLLGVQPPSNAPPLALRRFRSKLKASSRLMNSAWETASSAR